MMYNNESDILFPLRVAPTLRDLGGDAWRALVDRVARQEPGNPDSLAFVLMMARLGNCSACESDSLRFMRGCQACSRHALRRYRDKESVLMDLFHKAYEDVVRHFNLEGSTSSN